MLQLMHTCYRNSLDAKTCCYRQNSEKSLHIWKVYHVQKLSDLLIKLIIQDVYSLAEQMIMWCESRNLFLRMKMWHLSPPSVICVIGWECHLCYDTEFDAILTCTACMQNLCFTCRLTSKGRILSLFLQTFRKLFASPAVPVGVMKHGFMCVTLKQRSLLSLCLKSIRQIYSSVKAY